VVGGSIEVVVGVTGASEVVGSIEVVAGESAEVVVSTAPESALVAAASALELGAT
jgi:hypothetical protein